MKKQFILRLCAILLLLVIGLVGCDVENKETELETEETEEITESNELKATNATSKTTKKTSKKTEKQTEPKKTFAATDPRDPNKTKRVALTFDDGPDFAKTERMIALLEQYNADATFFVVGEKIEQDLDAAKDVYEYALECGMEIGIHAMYHDIAPGNYGDDCSDAQYEMQLSLTEEILGEILPGMALSLMRAPTGIISQKHIIECPYSVIFWNIDTYDWKYSEYNQEYTRQENIDRIVNTVKDNVKDGDIILMHDLYDNTYEATKILLEWLDSEGYEMVTITELLGENKQPGMLYHNAYQWDTNART